MYLLASGADANPEDRWGGRPLDDATHRRTTRRRERERGREREIVHLALYDSYATRLRAISIRHHDETAKALRHAGATHGSKGSHASSADLIDAASKGDLDAVKRLVEEQKIPIDVGDYDSRTPLHLAAGEGRHV